MDVVGKVTAACVATGEAVCRVAGTALGVDGFVVALQAAVVDVDTAAHAAIAGGNVCASAKLHAAFAARALRADDGQVFGARPDAAAKDLRPVQGGLTFAQVGVSRQGANAAQAVQAFCAFVVAAGDGTAGVDADDFFVKGYAAVCFPGAVVVAQVLVGQH